jgi:hypothetical protein
LDGQNQEKAFAKKNVTKPIGLPSFHKIVCLLWIHSLIKVEQLDKVLFAAPTLSDSLFSTHFSVNHILTLINIADTLQHTMRGRVIRSV